MIVTMTYARSETDGSRKGKIFILHPTARRKWGIDLYENGNKKELCSRDTLAGAQACARKWVE